MGRVMMVVGVPALLAPIFGPVLGGLIVDHLSWRWIFLVNVPVGVLSMLVSVRQLPADRPAAVRQGFDFGGLALLSPGLALLVYGLSRAGATGSFASTRAWLTMLAGVLLLALFVWYAGTRGERALIPLAYFRDRAFASATAVTLVISLSVFGVMLLLPLYYQQIRHQDALHAGHASTVLQIFSRVGGTLGAALMAVILAQQISAETSAGGGAPANPSAAYGTTFWWATAITAAGVLFALLLPGKAAGTDPTDAGRTPDQGQTASEFAA
jgi:predicted MFS family arabinose efflux permease